MTKTLRNLALVCLSVLLCALCLTSCGHEHAWSEWVAETDATCTQGGTLVRTCECGEKETLPIAAKGHVPGPEASCTGSQICMICNAEFEAAHGHTPGAAATCTTAQTCTVCNVELAPALGHTPSAAATCTTAQTCTVCNAELTAALGHQPGQWVTVKAATKTEDG